MTYDTMNPTNDIYAERDQLQARVKELETFLSEDVAPFAQDDGLSWKEALEDGTRIPVLRGSPKLSAFIVMLHQAAAEREQRADRLQAENNALHREAALTRGLEERIEMLQAEVERLKGPSAR